tara:strand:+ start:170 stop:553 length:384 start_codon:yes stop_codon:yes gene_type:complete
MSLAGCRSSGFLTADTAVNVGQCKLVSIHGVNVGANLAAGAPAFVPITLNLYDNASAATGKIVAKVQLGVTSYDGSAGNFGPTSIEFDMHGVICRNGLYADIVIPTAVAGGHASQNAATSGFTIEFA